ncbi:DUF871 domain-containing protein [Paenibacillus donghaensis]|uniref:DUF871 domain-containing protein n=1 Tax=Paenibacillus donghaensis TaxID=414771 RepID=A0A2Z2KAP6_9BACL|nr:MupG family TIM beta-alpha barrel fold protein [Paenibacillus donghaensis]ASA19990.1 hypothetical protein B9T62_03735 [Paenibacillus donghaensis]
MDGVLVSLTEQSVDKTVEYLKVMRSAGFRAIFTSLQMPEEDPSRLLAPLILIGRFAAEHNMLLMADVSPRTFASFSLAQLKEAGVTGLRIDYGMENAEIAELSQSWQISFNASTINEEFLHDLRALGANFDSLEAWHNYYPRPETGLGWDGFVAKNEWLQSQGLKVAAFIPGDGILRGPLHEGLPTLEQHRGVSSFAAYLELKQQGFTDRVLIGDLSVSDWTLQQFRAWKEGTVLLRVREQRAAQVWEQIHHNRPDIARDVIRSEEARRQSTGSIEPENCVERKAGALTLDNNLYKRYTGEFQIVLKPLPADERVNVIGYVEEADLLLLPFLQQSGHPFRFLASPPGNE